MSGLPIGEAAKRVGLSVHAVRYYEASGMVPPVARDSGGRRVFDDETLAWLEYATCLRDLGMPVRQVADYVAAASSGAPTEDARERMRRHLDLMKRRKDELDDYIALVEAKVAAMDDDR